MVALINQPMKKLTFYISNEEQVEVLFSVLAGMRRDFYAKPYSGGWRVDFECTQKEKEQFTSLGFFGDPK